MIMKSLPPSSVFTRSNDDMSSDSLFTRWDSNSYPDVTMRGRQDLSYHVLRNVANSPTARDCTSGLASART